jgi:hypothetical protein
MLFAGNPQQTLVNNENRQHGFFFDVPKKMDP